MKTERAAKVFSAWKFFWEMFIECPKCGNRYEIDQSNNNLEIKCGCDERLTVLPWLSLRQNVTEPGEVECSVCARKYNLGHYRNHTEIACACGNLLAVDIPDERSKGSGRRNCTQ